MTSIFEPGSESAVAIFEAIPEMAFIVDDDVHVEAFNRKAASLLGPDPDISLRRRGGEAFGCLRSKDHRDGCGRGPLCGGCVLRGSVTEAFIAGKEVRRNSKMELETVDGKRDVYLRISATPFDFLGKRRVLLLLEDINELVGLNRILALCSYCKKIRNEKDEWERMEAFFLAHLELYFSHSICPDCLADRFPEAKYLKA